MEKLSKSDDPQAVNKVSTMPTSKHFTKGSRVQYGHQHGEVLDVLTYPNGETSLRVGWDDGTVSIVQPFALNPYGITH